MAPRIFFLLLLIACSRNAGPSGPNVVLITIDTVRADHLETYGHARATAPHIDQLARDGIVFERAYAQAPWTLPSMATIHTALYPSQHGADERDRVLPEDVPVLAETLQAAGYETLGVVSQMFVSSSYGFDRGFDRFDEEHDLGHHGVTSRLLTTRAQEFLAERSGAPFFLWVHYFDPHSTYRAHDEHDFASGYAGSLPRDVVVRELRKDATELAAADVDYLRARYDGEIAFTDACFGALVRELEVQGVLEDTLIFLTSDHGEAFLEHDDLGHGKWCYDELVRVPLIVGGGALPAALRGLRIAAEVETRSLALTIARASGAEHAFGGIDLLSAPLDGDFQGFATIEGGYARGPDQRRISVVSDGWKLIRRLDEEEWELYDLRDDPDERANLIESADERAQAARLLLLPLVEELPDPGSAPRREISPEEMEKLRALGYVED